MANYTREQLKERWEKARGFMYDSITACYMPKYVIPGIWEVTIFPRLVFRNFLDRKIMEPANSAIMSRNESYDLDSGDTREWGWYSWRYYFDKREGCYVLELDYNVDTGDTKALPLVKGILDIALLESKDSIIGKFKWRIRWLQKIPLLRRIPPIFLFYFEMKKIEEVETIESTTGYPARIIEEDGNVIRFPEASDPWVGGYEFRSFYPYSDYGKRKKGEEEDDICFQ